MNKKISKEQSRKQPQFPLKPVCVAVLLAFTIQTTQANPVGPSVVNGQASFATTGNALTVTNTPGAIINWQGFSIGANEITRFAQQSASSAVLNRVISNNPSSILGTLQSNGRVFLVNPNGIVFGAGATIDVAGMVASTLNLSNTDFLAGRYNFTQVPGAANISNSGNLTAQTGGQIYLIAPNVENTGVITAPNGEILLAAGHSVELVNSNDPSLRVNITAPAGDATNVGQLIASSGSLGLFGTVVRNSGTVSADSATLQGGKIVFKASQRVEAGGTISAQGVGGGEIKLLADMQSGTVNVGGTLDASAPSGGDGGFIETSAHNVLLNNPTITATAPYGKGGTWLIDPTDVLMDAAYNVPIVATLNAGTNVTVATAATGAQLGDITVATNIAKTAGANAALTLQAHNNIIVNGGVTISSTVGALNVVFNADSDGLNGGAIVMNTGSSITSNGGNVILGGGIAGDGTGNAVGTSANKNGIDLLSASINAGAGSITLNGQGYGVGGTNMGVYLHSSASLTTTSGMVTVNGTGGGDGTSGSNRGVRISSGSSITTDIGNIDITGQGGWDGDGVQIVGGAQVKSTSGGQITLTGTTGLGAGLDYGIYLNGAGTLVETSGNILFTGVSNSVAGTDNKGIALYEATTPLTTGPVVRALGIGNVTFDGTGGGGTQFSSGMTISGSEVTVADGTITFNGTSGAATGTDNRGVNLHSSAWVHATGSGNINMTGVAVNSATASFGSGVRVASGAVVETVSGAINITGSGTNGTDSNYGVLITDAPSAVKSASGAISITGSGWGTGVTNYGIHVLGGSAISTTSGAISLNGTGGAGTDFNYGVSIFDAGTSISSVDGSISILGQGAGTGDWTMGVAMVGASVTSTGTAPIIINGTGSDAGSQWNIGVLLTNGPTVQSTDGDITIIGQGGANPSSWYNYGMLFQADAAVLSNGAGKIILNGTGGAGVSHNGYGNYGVYLVIPSSRVEAANGSISITGQSAGSGDNQIGIFIQDAGYSGRSGIVSTGLAPITLDGTGTGTAGSYGIALTAGDISGSVGNVTLKSSNDLYINGIISASGGGNVVLRADSGGTGTGTIIFTGGSVALSGGGRADLYYNPVSYADTATKSDALTNPYTANVTSPYTAWMLVNDVGLETGGTLGLQAMNTNLTGNYALGTNIIDASATFGWNAGAGFVPVGNTVAFTGQFDGLNHTISNLFINRPLELNVGLFGVVGDGVMPGFVRNVGLVGGSVAGMTNVGGLAGHQFWGDISNSYNTGTVSGNNSVGGLVGFNEFAGYISSSYVSGGSVSGLANVGGLVGWNQGFISNSYVSGGTVTGFGNGAVGGLVGYNLLSGDISNSYVSGVTVSTIAPAPSGSNAAGGLVGFNLGTISNSYVSGGSVTGFWGVGGLVGNDSGVSTSGSYVSNVIVNGSTDVGGLVGYNSSTISNSYVNGGMVTGDHVVGGLVGYNNGSISNSYVSDSTIIGNNTWTGSVGGLVGYNNGSISNTYVSGGSVASAASDSGWVGGLVGNNLGTITTSYASTGVVATRVGGTPYGFAGLVGGNTGFGSVTDSFWDVDTSGQATGIGAGSTAGATGIYSSTPIVNAFTQATYTGFDFGTTWWMSEGNTRPFLQSEWSTTITNAHQLQLMAMNLGASYTLANSLDLAPALAAGGMWSNAGFVPIGTGWPGFSGQFDGQNFTISNLTITRPTESYVGLFGYSGGALRNVGLLNATVNGGWSVGALAGNSWGDITNSYVDNSVSGSVSGNSNVGGLVGYNGGTISDSYVIGSSSYVPGVSVATVSGGSRVGGLVGSNGGIISNSWADSVHVTGNYDVGGLVGGNNDTIDGSRVINNSTVEGSSSVGGLVGNGYWDIISNSWADSVHVTGNYDVGGLVGYDSGEGAITSNHVINSTVSGSSNVGGLVGYLNSSCYYYCTGSGITNSYVSGGSVSGSSNVGGLVGQNFNNISNSYVSGVSVSGNSNVGGLVGANGSTESSSSGSSISNSYVSGGSVTGSNSVGGLVGNNSGTISNSYVSGGMVTVTGSDQALNAGGLVGYNTGTISNSYVSGGTVSATSSGWDAGGLVGYNTGTISNSYVDGGTVSGNSLSTIGGLVGYNSGNISNSYVTNGTVNGNSDVAGGLVGYNSGSISNSYVSGGSVNGTWDVGGLVGNNNGSISNSYVTNGTVVSGNGNVGGLVGYNGGGTITNSHFNVDGVTLNGANQVTLGGLYSFQYQDWFDGGLDPTPLTPLLIGDYAATLPLVGGTYTISSVQGMKDLLGFADAGYSFTLASNVALPTGYNVPYLAGSFDGGTSAGYTLSGLDINLPNSTLGLFNHVAAGSTVNNVGLDASAVTGRGDVGALAGLNEGTISNSHVINGTVSGSSGSRVGGLVGQNSGTISNSYVSGGSVSGSYSNVGGLVGRNTGGSITDSYTSGVTVNGSYNVGGLVGVSDGIGSNISNSYVIGGGTVNDSGSNAGGLVGYNRGNISGSYVSGETTVNGSYNVGGLVGYNDGGEGGGAISNSSVSNSNVTGTTNVGGLVGYNYYGSIDTSYVSGGTVSGNSEVGGLVGYSYYGSIDASYATASVTGDSYVGGLAGRMFSGGINFSHATGNVTGTGDYVGGLVGSAEWQFGIYDSYATGNVTSTAGYYVGGLVGSANRASDTIARSYATGDVTGASYVGGLVGYNWDVNIDSTYATGNVTGTGDYVGGLVGWNGGSSSYAGGSISNSYATGNVSGSNNVGGLVGYNYGYISAGVTYGGRISNSYASNGSVSGSSNVGGLVGHNRGSVSNTYVSGGTVSGSNNVGGLVGYNNTTGSDSPASISNSYVSGGTVSGSSNVGGLVGYNYYSNVSNSFWDSALVGATLTNGIGYNAATSLPSDVGAVGLTLTQMTAITDFAAAGWSIANTGGSGAVWRIYEGHTTPLLTAFLTPLAVSGTDSARIYTPSTITPSIWHPGTSVVTGNILGVVGDLYSVQLGYDLIEGSITAPVGFLADLMNMILIPGGGASGSSQSTISTVNNKKPPPPAVVALNGEILPADSNVPPLPVCRR